MSPVHSGKMLPEWLPWGCGLPSREDSGLGLGLGPLLTDSGLPGSNEEAGHPQGPGAEVQGAKSWGHSASLSPKEEHEVRLAGGNRPRAWGPGRARTPCTSPQAPSLGLLLHWAACPVPPSGHDLPHTEAESRRLPGLQPRGDQGSGLTKPLRPRCWVFCTFAHSLQEASI